MSCYLRHLGDILLAAGVPLSRESRARIHTSIQEIAGQRDCPRVWKQVKPRLVREDDRERFVSELRERWRRRPASD